MKRHQSAFPDMVRKGISALLALLLCVSLFPAGASADGGTPMVIGSVSFQGLFSPFFSNTLADIDVVDLTQIPLIDTDRTGSWIMKGISGQISSYNSIRFTYYTAADCENRKEEDHYVYDITLRDDLVFSDGEPLTADDVIFSFYVLSDPSYDGTKGVADSSILGMEAYRSGAADHIEGIQKIDDTHLRVISTKSWPKLTINIAPLHYYGDPAQYDYENHHFGFPKGDLSMIRAKDAKPLGAGPYRFVSCENGVVTMEANPFYFRGEPKTKTVIITSVAGNVESPEAVLSGSVDIFMAAYQRKASETVKSANGNDRITGPVIAVRTYDDDSFCYIGINANLVKVGNDPGSEASRALRKAFATLFSVYREEAVTDYFGDTASVINYSISRSASSAPKPTDVGYQVAFSSNAEGNPIYTAVMNQETKEAAALQAALGFFEKAGYTVDGGRLTAAPEGASLTYTFTYVGGGVGNHPAALVCGKAKTALDSIGMNLIIEDLKDSGPFWDYMNAGKIQMWVARGGHSNNLTMPFYSDAKNGPSSGAGLNPAGGPDQSANNSYYGIADPELDEIILEARTITKNDPHKKAIWECLDIILDWAVDVPFYQRLSAVFVSAERVDVDTFPKEITTDYSWMKEIEKIAMK